MAPWEVKKLGDIGKIYNGNSINEKVKKDRYTDVDEGLPFIATKDVSYVNIIDYDNGIKIPFEEKEQFKIAPKNTVLICAEGGSAGRKIGFTNQDICFGNKLFALTANKNIESSYVFYYYFTSSFQKQFSLSLTGLIGGVSMNKFKEIGIPIPSLSEQKHIVVILDEAFESISKAKENAEKNLKNAKEIFESYLKSVFENKIHGIESEALENICELIVDCEHKTAPIQETGYPSIRTPNIGKGFLILDNVNRVSEETYLEWTKRAIPQASDLILAREAPAGNVAVIPENIKVCLGQRTVLIRPKKDKINSKYLAFLLLSKDVQEKLLLHSRGATVAHVNMKDIRAFKIYNLSSLSEQKSIVSKLDALSTETKKLEAIYEKKLADLEELKKSILAKAFNGKLTEASA
ncbi:MAG: restriction endonuclease subunit S [Candidatus Methanoperedens sp.]|nr:restriction endonuclease subunit S [Candidatus Methanoperedens sp.]